MRNLSCTPSFLAPFANCFPFSTVSHTALYPIPSFRAQREIFFALHHFLLLSLTVSLFPLSRIRRYTSVQERSLDYARDDNTRIAIFKHIRCTLHGIDLFPPRRHEGRSEKSYLHAVISCFLRKWFPLFHCLT